VVSFIASVLMPANVALSEPVPTPAVWYSYGTSPLDPIPALWMPRSADGFSLRNYPEFAASNVHNHRPAIIHRLQKGSFFTGRSTHIVPVCGLAKPAPKSEGWLPSARITAICRTRAFSTHPENHIFRMGLLNLKAIQPIVE